MRELLSFHGGIICVLDEVAMYYFLDDCEIKQRRRVCRRLAEEDIKEYIQNVTKNGYRCLRHSELEERGEASEREVDD